MKPNWSSMPGILPRCACAVLVMKPMAGLPRRASSESMRALLATIKVPAGWAGAGGGERGEGHQAGQESSLLGRRRRWHGPRVAAPLPRRLGVGRSGPTRLLATRAVGTQRARSGRWREASPEARIAPIQGGRRAGGSAAGAGGGVGWGASGASTAKAANLIG